MTEPEDTTSEVSTISEYVDTIAESESEYASPGLRRQNMEDTEISTVIDNKCISDEMNEVIIDMPVYIPEQLEDISPEAKLLGRRLIVFSLLLAIVPMVLLICFMKYESDTYGNPKMLPPYDGCLVVLSMFIWAEAGLSVMFAGRHTEYVRTRDDGKVGNCGLPKTDKGIRMFRNLFLVYDIFKVSCFLIGNLYTSLKLAIFVYIIFNRVLTIGAVFYSKKYCRCPACYESLRPEDVRIVYGNKAMNMKSKILITSLELQEYFGISLINGTHLGVMDVSGNIVHDFRRSGARPFRTGPGLYLVKILQVIFPGEPEYSCDDCGTCTPWNKIEKRLSDARATKTIIIG